MSGGIHGLSLSGNILYSHPHGSQSSPARSSFQDRALVSAIASLKDFTTAPYSRRVLSIFATMARRVLRTQRAGSAIDGECDCSSQPWDLHAPPVHWAFSGWQVSGYWDIVEGGGKVITGKASVYFDFELQVSTRNLTDLSCDVVTRLIVYHQHSKN